MTISEYFHELSQRLAHPSGRLVFALVLALVLTLWSARRLEWGGGPQGQWYDKTAATLASISLPFSFVGIFAIAWGLFNLFTKYSGALLVTRSPLGSLGHMFSMTGGQVYWLIPAFLLAAAALFAVRSWVQYVATIGAFWGVIVVVNFGYIVGHLVNQG